MVLQSTTLRVKAGTEMIYAYVNRVTDGIMLIPVFNKPPGSVNSLISRGERCVGLDSPTINFRTMRSYIHTLCDDAPLRCTR